MYHFATALSAGIIATVLVSGTAFMPTPADAAKMSNAESVALKQATVACKAEAKGRPTAALPRPIPHFHNRTRLPAARNKTTSPDQQK
jgi:hypothetical protein